MQPFPPAEAARRTYATLTGAQPAEPPPSQVSMPGKPEPARSFMTFERFPKRLGQLSFVMRIERDPRTREYVRFIRPPLCPMPAGPFLMGSDPQQDNQAQPKEQQQHQLTLPAFQIGTFPVTVAEYACFVAAGHGAPPEGFHSGTDWPAQLTRLDHPVTCVTWYGAHDYAVWLARLTGQPWALPSEAEWEKAARWDPGGNEGRGLARIYPWGDRFDSNRCNTLEFNVDTLKMAGINATTAVGSYGPENASRDGSSPCGAQDMVGNVFERTSTLFRAYPYTESDGRENPNSPGERVLRGGSWGSIGGPSAAFRTDYDPLTFYDDRGFRVVLRA